LRGLINLVGDGVDLSDHDVDCFGCMEHAVTHAPDELLLLDERAHAVSTYMPTHAYTYT
jgi:hypothetical protein